MKGHPIRGLGKTSEVMLEMMLLKPLGWLTRHRSSQLQQSIVGHSAAINELDPKKKACSANSLSSWTTISTKMLKDIRDVVTS